MSTDTRHPWPDPLSLHTLVFDFDGVFTDNKVYITQDGIESVRCDRGDGLGIDLLRAAMRLGRLRAEMFILSKETNPVVLARARKLKLECRHGIGAKDEFMDRYLAETRPDDPRPYQGLAFLGNDLNDLPLLMRAGVSVVPQDAHPAVKAQASLILSRRGGDGFVRAFVEGLLGLDGMSSGEVNELIRHC